MNHVNEMYNKEMSWVYALAPAANLLFASYIVPGKPCRPRPYVWQPNGAVFIYAWTALAITTGISGYQLGAPLNDLTANEWFIALVFLLGPGYVLSNAVCKQWFQFLYVALTFGVSLGLLLRLQELDGPATGPSTTAQHQALIARNYLIPLQVWLAFATLLSLFALYKKSFP